MKNGDVNSSGNTLSKEQEKVRKVLHLARPFVFTKDIDDAKAGNFYEAGSRIRKRGTVLIVFSFISAAIFLFNAAFHMFEYGSSYMKFSLILSIMWFGLAIYIMYFGFRHFTRMREAGQWLIRKSMKEG
jgi:hypothetical protein